MPLKHLLGLASWAASPVTGVVRTLVISPRDRRLWSSGDRTHLEVRGIHRPGTAAAAREIEQRLGALDGVFAAELNAVLGRVAVHHDPTRITLGELAGVIGEVETAHGLDTEPMAPASAVHPANTAPLARELTALATNVAGLGYWATGQILPLVRIPPLVPALMSLVDFTPLLRSEVETRLGRAATDMVFSLGGAVSNTLAQSPAALVTDAVRRFCSHREATARQQAWHWWDGERLAGRAGSHRAEPLDVESRPIPLPDGPIERVATSSAALALASYVVVLAASRNPARALGMLHAGLPKPAKAGRDAFVAQLGTDLGKGDGLVLEPDVLHRLDRVDTVVLDADALLTGRRVVEEVLALEAGLDCAELFHQAHDLIDLDQVESRSERAGWSAVPLAESTDELPAEARRTAREWSARGATVFVILHHSRPVGLVSVAAELDPFAEAVVAAASAALVLVAAATSGLDRRLGTDGVVTGGAQLADSVRALQANGHVVAVLSARSRSALAAADVGIGIPHRSGMLPWGAHVLFLGLAEATVLLHAVAAARDSSRTSAALSVAGSAVGALLATFGPAAGAGSRAAFPVHLTTLFAIAAGTWAGASPAQKPAPVAVERTPWHVMSPQTTLERLGSGPGGLDQEESERRLAEQPGTGDGREVGLVRASMEELANPLTPALAGGAGLSASVGSVVDALMIGGVLGLNALIGGAQRLGANRALRALRTTSAGQVRLRRDGIERTTSAAELVPGDIIELHAGDAVPADCRLLEATALEVDEASLTGESTLVTKAVQATAAASLGDRHSMLYQGSVVAAGQAIGVVVATGDRTEAGRTARLNAEAPPPTGVQTRLTALTRQTLPVSIGAGLGLLGIDLLRGSPVNQALG
nr:cation-transporting ATPase [Actinomycetota bacterium]